MDENKPQKQENNKDSLGRFIKGFSGNPGGRPKGPSLKTWVRKKMREMDDEQRVEFMKGLPKEIIWKMAEGNPDNKTDLTSDGKPLFNDKQKEASDNALKDFLKK